MDHEQEVSIQEKLRLFRRVVQTSAEESISERRELLRSRFEKNREELENEAALLKQELRRKAGRESEKEALRSEREAREALRQERLQLRGSLFDELMGALREAVRQRLIDGRLAPLLERKMQEDAPPKALKVGPEYRALLQDRSLPIHEEAGLEGVLAEREDGLILNFSLDELLRPLRREAAALLDRLIEENGSSPAAKKKEAPHA